MGIIEGKFRAVTSGGGSSGLAAAQALPEEGAWVLLVRRAQDKLARAAAALSAGADVLDTLAADIADAA